MVRVKTSVSRLSLSSSFPETSWRAVGRCLFLQEREPFLRPKCKLLFHGCQVRTLILQTIVRIQEKILLENLSSPNVLLRILP